MSTVWQFETYLGEVSFAAQFQRATRWGTVQVFFEGCGTFRSFVKLIDIHMYTRTVSSLSEVSLGKFLRVENGSEITLAAAHGMQESGVE